MPERKKKSKKKNKRKNDRFAHAVTEANVNIGQTEIMKKVNEFDDPGSSESSENVENEDDFVCVEAVEKIERVCVNDVFEGNIIGSGDARILMPMPSLVPSFEEHLANEILVQNSLDTSSEEESSEVRLYKLDFIRHDWFEKNEEMITVHLYVKEVVNGSIRVDIDECDLKVTFKTKDKKFLQVRSIEVEEKVEFLWCTILAFPVIDVSYQVKSCMIDLTFTKANPARWNCLSKVVPRRMVQATGDSPTLPRKESPISSPVPSPPARTVTPKQFKSTGQAPATVGKPTCLVSPLNKVEGMVVPPGMTGLNNLGNTCFLNCVLQVLVNTKPLRDYFLQSLFQSDINADNPLGSGGSLAVSFAVLNQVLWSGTTQSYSPSKLKALVSQKASQFSGFAQHDAQEFMAFLLDGLHEDLNRVKQKPYIEQPDSDGRPDHVVADEAWNLHRQRNDSFIVDLFQGQYKSKLVCPSCHKVSITFDPFMNLAVPLPKKLRQINVIFRARDPHMQPKKLTLAIESHGTVEKLRLEAARVTGTDVSELRIYEIYRRRFHRVIQDSVNLTTITSEDDILIAEVLSPERANEAVVELAVIVRNELPSLRLDQCPTCQQEQVTLKRCCRCYRTSYCSLECQKKDWAVHRIVCRYRPEFVGEPFVLSFPKSQATYSRVLAAMEMGARWSVDVFSPPNQANSAPLSPLPNLERQAWEAGEPEVDLDFQPHSPSDLTNDLVSPAGTPSPTRADRSFVLARPHADSLSCVSKIRLVDREGVTVPDSDPLTDKGDIPLDFSSSLTLISLDWNNNERTAPHVYVTSKDLDFLEIEMDQRNNDEPSLEKCLELFTEPEILSPEHAWYCPRCKSHQEATKQLSLWRLPNILIIQLKRFSFRNLLWRDKLDTMVKFPVTGLKMEQFGAKQSEHSAYDLYGIINHHGGILGGHYTAYARCLDQYTDKEAVGWRLFDDSQVAPVPESQIVTPSAYVLFYRKR